MQQLINFNEMEIFTFEILVAQQVKNMSKLSNLIYIKTTILLFKYKISQFVFAER